MRGWRRLRELFLYKEEVVKTTWKLRITLFAVFMIFCLVTGRFWLVWVGQSLIYEDKLAPTDVILVENFEAPFLAGLSRAVKLRDEGYSERILVVRLIPRESRFISSNFLGQVWDSYCQAVGIDDPEIVAVEQVEPVTKNMAKQLASTLKKTSVESAILISGIFHSKRSCLVYREVLEPLGIQLRCLPVSGAVDPDHWWKTSHDALYVVEEFLKLQYYRLFVLAD